MNKKELSSTEKKLFEKMELSVKKIKFNQNNISNKELPLYKITIIDLVSEVVFEGYAYEKIDLNIAIFTDYVFSILLSEGFVLENSKMYLSSFFTSSKKSFLNDDIAKEYKVRFLKKENSKYSNKNQAFIKTEIFNDKKDFITKARAYHLIQNLKKLKNKNLSKNDKKKNEKLIYKILPIICDDYLGNFKQKYFFESSNKNEIYTYDSNDYIETERSLLYLKDKYEKERTKVIKQDEILENYQIIHDAFKYINNYKEQILVALQIAHINLSLANKECAEIYLKRALKLSNKKNILEYLPSIYQLLGYKSLISMEFKKASYYYNKHLKKSLDNNNKIEIGIAYLNLNMLYINSGIGNEKKRVINLNKALKIFTEAKI